MTSGRRSVVRAAAGLLVGSLAVVAASGLWLARNYRPAPSVRETETRYRAVLGGGWIHEAHVWSAIVLTVAAAVVVAIVLLEVLQRGARRRGRRLPLGGAALFAGSVVLGLWSSRGLRWWSLGLWAVTVNSDYRGVWRPAFSDTVRFLFVGGEGEVVRDEYRVRVLAHLLAAPALLVASGLLLAVAARVRSWQDGR